MIGAILVVAGLTVVEAVRAVPSWHHADVPWETGLRWWTVGAATATIVPAVVHIAARLLADRRLDRVDIAMTVLGLATLVGIAIGGRAAREETESLQALPGVIDSASILTLILVIGYVVGIVNLSARRASTTYRTRHRLGRRFVAGLVGTTAILTTIGVFVALPDGPSPRAGGADTWQDLTVEGPVRIDWHETFETEPALIAPVPAPITGGFVLPGRRSVTAYMNGEQVWTLDFDAPVSGVWGASPDTTDSSWLLVQVSYSAGGPLTYALDGRTGDVLWRTDAVGLIAQVTMDDDDAVVLTSIDPEVISVERGDGAVAVLTDIDTDDGCANPERFDLVGSGSDRMVAVPLVCRDLPDRFAVYRTDRSGPRRVYTGTEFGLAADDAVRISASDGGIAAVTAYAAGSASTRFIGPDGPVAIADVPDRWVVTGLIDRGRGEWTVTAVDTDGYAAVIHATPAQNKTVAVGTLVRADTAHDAWARVGDSLVTAGGYLEAQDVGGSTLPQNAPLTYVGAPVAGSGTDRSMPAVTTKSNPCRQSRGSDDRAFAIGGSGVLLRCSGDISVSHEWIWVR